MSILQDFDPDRDSGEAPSPCIGVCRMNVQSGWCEGCWRSIDEIARWSTASEEAKRAVWREIRRRLAPPQGVHRNKT